MYESPINITKIYEDIISQIQEQTESLVFQEIQRVGVYVDKEELTKALQYDRDQYEKGYKEGYERAMEICRAHRK